jgi:hypothetical protein
MAACKQMASVMASTVSGADGDRKHFSRVAAIGIDAVGDKHLH